VTVAVSSSQFGDSSVGDLLSILGLSSSSLDFNIISLADSSTDLWWLEGFTALEGPASSWITNAVPLSSALPVRTLTGTTSLFGYTINATIILCIPDPNDSLNVEVALRLQFNASFSVGSLPTFSGCTSACP